ncbi:MAG: hypothetical protein K6B65_07005 [Bacilli bacterium]|nr:hypothetical protein [Bacilli bacterium]
MKDKNIIRLVGVGVGAALTIAAFFLFAAPFLSVTGSIGSWSTTFVSTGWAIAFAEEPKPGILIAWILSLVLMVAVIGVCVMLVLDKLGVVKVGIFENKMAVMGCAALIAVLGIVVGLLAFLTLPLVGAPDGVGLGIGAIFVGILSILGGCASACGLVAPIVMK